MLVAVKGNRETRITADEKDLFIESGHKIIEIGDNGKQKVISDPDKIAKGANAEKLKALEAQLSEKDTQIEELQKVISEKDTQIEDIQAELKKVSENAKKDK